MTPQEAAQQLVGTPYLLGGETVDGCDCWGLCRLFARLAGGPALPDLRAAAPDEHDDLAPYVAAQARGSGWERVEDRAAVRAFDVLEIDGGSGVAIAVCSRTMLATSRPLRAAVCLPIWGIRWRRSLTGVFRLVDTAAPTSHRPSGRSAQSSSATPARRSPT